MLERVKERTRNRRYTHIEYARFADDLVILVDGYPRWERLAKKVYQQLLEELEKLDVQLNEEKRRLVDLRKKDSFCFLGFEFRRGKIREGKWGVYRAPTMKARTTLLRKLKDIFRRFQSQPVERLIERINPILRGWVIYFRVGNASRCFGYVKGWVEKKVRRHLMRARNRPGFGWNRWSRNWLYRNLGLYHDYQVRYS